MRCEGAFKHACKLAGVVVIAFVLAACAKKPEEALYGAAGGSDGPVTPGSSRDFAVNVGDKIHFETDSSELTGEAQGILRGQAQWLQRYPQYTITLEGHADERGTREYNIALGAQRATAVKTYLTQLGVPAARMRTLSYGKERPVAVCNDISCWSQNRRAQTLLNSRSGA